jgi:hypothetical protein
MERNDLGGLNLILLFLGVFFLLATNLIIERRKLVIVNYLFILTVFIIIQLLTQDMSLDFDEYKNFYNSVETLSEIINGKMNNFNIHYTNFEIGYKILNVLFKQISNNIMVMFVFINTITLTLLFNFIKRNNYSFYDIILPYYSFMYISLQLGIIRQAIAVSIFIYSIRYLKNREGIKYFFLILTAFYFHRSALILFPLYFFINRKIKQVYIIISYVLIILLYILKIDIFGVIFNFGLNFFYSNGNSILNKIIFYIENSLDNNYLGIGFIERFFIFNILIYIRSVLEKKNKYNKFLNICYNLSMFSILFQTVAFNFAFFTVRLRYYFLIFRFFLISSFIINLKSNEAKVILKMILIVYSFLMFYIKLLRGV